MLKKQRTQWDGDGAYNCPNQSDLAFRLPVKIDIIEGFSFSSGMESNRR